jgi:hypothetical protein
MCTWFKRAWRLFVANTREEMEFEWETFMQPKLLQTFNIDACDGEHLRNSNTCTGSFLWLMQFSPYVVPIIQVSWSCATIVDVVMNFNSDWYARSLIVCDDECWMCYTFICSLFILSRTSPHAQPSWTHHHHIITLQNTTHFNRLAISGIFFIIHAENKVRGKWRSIHVLYSCMNYEKCSWNSHGHYEDHVHDYVENRLCMKCSRVRTPLKNLLVKILMYFQSKLFSIMRLVTHCLWHHLRWGDLPGKNLATTDYFGMK